MRNISAPSLAKLATRFGTEPIALIKVYWTAGNGTWYADRTVGSIPGKIVQIGELDAVVDILGGGQSAAVSVVLDDTDGSIKDILDHHDIHKRPCRIYQWFDGLPLEEAFVIAEGQISSPVSWKERERTVSFTIVTQLEGEDVGYSAKDAGMTVPDTKLDTPWPMVFGTAVNVPAVCLTDPAEDVILSAPLSIHDFTLPMQREVVATQRGYANVLGLIFANQADYAREQNDEARANTFAEEAGRAYGRVTELSSQISELTETLTKQQAEEATSTVRLVGGNSLPQGQQIKLNIDGGLFTGSMSGETFHVLNREHPEKATKKDTPHIDIGIHVRYPEEGPRELVYYRETVRDSSGAGMFTARAGSTVKPLSEKATVYAVSAIAGNVLSVVARRRIDQEERWVVVPQSYYTVDNTSGVKLHFPKALSAYEGENWSDQVYVTFQSSVGPSLSNVLSYLLNHYMPGYSLTGVPSINVNFALLSTQNVIQLVKDIARQANCALWFQEGVCHVVYLPDLPNEATVSISESDIVPGSLEVYATNTEDLVTKLVAKWRPSYDEDESEIALTNNISRYGTHEETEDYYVYNTRSAVESRANWRLTRLSTTWKKIRFRTLLNKLHLEPYDSVRLDFSHNYVADGPITGIVEKANFDSVSNEIDFEVWLPIPAGSM